MKVNISFANVEIEKIIDEMKKIKKEFPNAQLSIKEIKENRKCNKAFLNKPIEEVLQSIEKTQKENPNAEINANIRYKIWV